jgi:hypothetical protein
MRFVQADYLAKVSHLAILGERCTTQHRLLIPASAQHSTALPALLVSNALSFGACCTGAPASQREAATTGGHLGAA